MKPNKIQALEDLLAIQDGILDLKESTSDQGVQAHCQHLHRMAADVFVLVSKLVDTNWRN